MSARIAGVLLAAGTSSRMGKNKLFVELGGKTVLRRAAQTALAAGLSPLIVVVGHESERARAELDGLACVPVFNAEYQSGISSSLIAGIGAVPDDVDAAVVLLADMPFVTAASIGAVIAAWHGEPIAISRYGDVVAPPTLYAKRLFAELRAKGASGKEVVQRHRAETREVPQPELALRDLDVPADVELAKRELG